MNFITRLANSVKTKLRSFLTDPPEWFVRAINGGYETPAGETISPEQALRITTCFTCTRILAESIGCLPLITYERLEGDAKKRAGSHYLYKLLKLKPNSEMTAVSFKEALVNHLANWGNHYSEIEFDNAGRVIGLWPLLPDRTFPRRDKRTGLIVYETRLPDGRIVALPSYRVLHIPGMGFDGIVGYPVLEMMRNSLGLTKAAETFGSRFFGNGTHPGAVVEHPGKLGDVAHANLKESLAETYSGLGKAHRLMILEEGMKFQSIGIPPEQAQFLETRKFQRSEIFGFYRIPPHMGGDLERSTNNNIEHQSLDLVKYTLLPWFTRIENSINTKLFRVKDQEKYFCEFLVDALLRGDIESRFKAYQTGIQNGIYCPDDVRAKENMNPRPDGLGGKFLKPMNYEYAGQKTEERESGNAC
jgi:HK97 family phage portal protein